MRKKIAVIGGDSRMISAAEDLRADFDIALFGFDGGEFHGVVDSFCCSGGATERPNTLDSFDMADTLDDALKDCEAAVLPIPALVGENISTPFSDKSVNSSHFMESMKANNVAKLFGGMLGKLNDASHKLGIKAYDYYDLESFVTANAALTAEGAISVAMENLTSAIMGMKVMVLGFGRIGKLLSLKLSSLGAKVTVSARSQSDLAIISALGMETSETKSISEHFFDASPYGVIFNTIPHMVIGKKELESLDKNTLIIDLASKPGGIDISAAGALGRHVIWALSLPGRYAPESAGRIVAKTVRSFMI